MSFVKSLPDGELHQGTAPAVERLEVLPESRRVCAEQDEIALSEVTLWPIGMVPSVHSLACKLDAALVQAALAKLASYWPNLCGRFVRRPSAREHHRCDYFIRLTSSPIPLEISYAPETKAPFDSVDVIQDDISPYISPLRTGSQLDNLGAEGSLFAVKLTYTSTHTVIGLSWGHILGDGASFAMLTRAFSWLCAHPEQDLPSDMWPNFGPHVDFTSSWPPSNDALSLFANPILYPTFSLADGGAKYGDAISSSELVRLRLSASEVESLRAKAAEEAGGFVTAQDAMSAALALAMLQAGVPLERFQNSVNYRTFYPGGGRFFPATLPRLCANTAQMYITPIDHSETLGGLAKTLRESLTRLRQDEEYARDWLANAAYRLEQACDEGRMQVMVPKSSTLIVNSNYRYDWNERFGAAPGVHTSFHTSFTLNNFLRVFKPNPREEEQEADGKAAEWAFRVDSGKRQAVIDALETILGRGVV